MSSALARQDPLQVKKAVEDFLRAQTAGLPGKVSFTVGPLDPANQLAPCPALEVSVPPGAKTWGRTNVAVRCQAEQSWSVFLPVHVRVVTDYLVAALPLAQGQTVTAADLARQEGDLSDLPAGVLTDERQAIGRTVTMPVGVGRPLRGDLLRLPMVVQQNQSVKVVSQGPGFQVTNEGRALNNGVEGQVVQVRLSNGQVVSGVARAGGVVAINF
jgi:flagella basal body P-ring formation protein FlgA